MADQHLPAQSPGDTDSTAVAPDGADGAESEGSTAPGVGADAPRPVYRLFGRQFRKPGSRTTRIALGVALCVAGLFRFLPVLGFWMIPLGLLILSHEYHLLRRIRRRWAVRNGRRRAAKAANNNGISSNRG